MSGMKFNLPIQKSLMELVYLELKDKILKGEIESYTRLMEISLAEKMNVSRTPIRKAIKKLADDGLVTIEPRRGAYVSKISVKDMVDVFEVREDLESFAAYLAAQRIKDPQKSQLKHYVEMFESAVENNDKEKMIEFDSAFHSFIVECSDNRTLIDMVDHIQELSLRFRYLYYDDVSQYIKMPAEHRRIMEAIISGDSDRAREETDAHVKALKECIFNLEKKWNHGNR